MQPRPQGAKENLEGLGEVQKGGMEAKVVDKGMVVMTEDVVD